MHSDSTFATTIHASLAKHDFCVFALLWFQPSLISICQALQCRPLRSELVTPLLSTCSLQQVVAQKDRAVWHRARVALSRSCIALGVDAGAACDVVLFKVGQHAVLSSIQVTITRRQMQEHILGRCHFVGAPRLRQTEHACCTQQNANGMCVKDGHQHIHTAGVATVVLQGRELAEVLCSTTI